MKIIHSPSQMLAPITQAKVALQRAAAPDQQPQYVTREEVHAALRLLSSKPEVACFVEFLWVTGARLMEALGVRKRDLDLAGCAVTLTTLKRRRTATRVLPLPEPFCRALSLLAAQLGADKPLFPWRRARAGQLVREALEAVGVAKDPRRKQTRASARGLRHGHAVHALRSREVSLATLQRSLGHAFIASTNAYCGVTAEDVRREYARVEW